MVSLLAEDYPYVRFLVVGDNVLDGAQGDRHRSRVIAAVGSDPALQKRVIFTGFREDTECVMAATDILVCASDFESFGMVHLEAMASGVPVASRSAPIVSLGSWELPCVRCRSRRSTRMPSRSMRRRLRRLR